MPDINILDFLLPPVIRNYSAGNLNRIAGWSNAIKSEECTAGKEEADCAIVKQDLIIAKPASLKAGQLLPCREKEIHILDSIKPVDKRRVGGPIQWASISKDGMLSHGVDSPKSHYPVIEKMLIL